MIPYPLFRRLAFFAAAQNDVVPHQKGLDWLLADNGWWLWSSETRREAIRLLAALGPQLDGDELDRLESAILLGPPRAMYPQSSEEEFLLDQDRGIWLLLAKLSETGTNLGDSAQKRPDGISGKYPEWRLAEDEQDEFSFWFGDGKELRVSVAAPQELDKLIEWLKEHPKTDWRQLDDWREICRDNFETAAAALTTLANQGIWPVDRWREALQSWSEGELVGCSWRGLALVIATMPDPDFLRVSHAVSWWLEKTAKTLDLSEHQQDTFFGLCDRVLELDFDVGGQLHDPVGQAINHEVGLITGAILGWWYRRKPMDGEGLIDVQRSRLEQLCNTDILKFRPGRVMLATHVISLFRVDPAWTQEFVLKLFDWDSSHKEARFAWNGFLRSPRLYQPLFEVLKSTFLETPDHYEKLDPYKESFASLLTFIGLEASGIFENRELMCAINTLPQDGLDHVAVTFADAVDSAGEQRATYWENKATPFLSYIWPKTPANQSQSIAVSFSLACIAAGDAFPKALKQVRPWLMRLRHPDHPLDKLHDTGLDARFPDDALELMDLIVGDNAEWLDSELKECLITVRDEKPELKCDPRFRRLVEILKVDGGDLE